VKMVTTAAILKFFCFKNRILLFQYETNKHAEFRNDSFIPTILNKPRKNGQHLGVYMYRRP